jgi:hypothetical protein
LAGLSNSIKSARLSATPKGNSHNCLSIDRFRRCLSPNELDKAKLVEDIAEDFAFSIRAASIIASEEAAIHFVVGAHDSLRRFPCTE